MCCEDRVLIRDLVKAAQINDPKVNQVIEQTEQELKNRETGLMEKHQEVLSHGKATLELKQDLARQQVKGMFTFINIHNIC